MLGKEYRIQTTLIIVTIILMILSIMFIYSSSFTAGMRKFNNGNYFVIKQSIWYIIGFISMIIISTIDYRKYSKYKGLFFVGGIIILALVLLVGKNINGAKRWIRLGPLSFQPSEMAKLIFIIYFAGMLEKFKKTNVDDIYIVLKGVMALFIYMIFILLEKDLGTAIHLGIIVFFMLILSGINWGYILSVFFMNAFIGFFIIFISKNRIHRIINYISGMKHEGISGGYQVRQSVIGISNGGFFGMGYGNGLQKYFYLPELHTDFILSVISEELGFIGVSFLCFLYIMILIMGFKIASRASDYFGKFLASGITVFILSQAVINILVATGLIPTTGMPLPFISAGGSSIFTLLISMGILLNIARKGELE